MSLSRTEIIKTAFAEASRVLAKCKVSLTEPVDIFKIIDNYNVVLNFQRLENLAGAYIPETEERRAGILINENLPLTRQRYTAAHEFCHFIRGDSASFDTSEELFYESYKREDKERIAEEFASCLLMPRRLVMSIHKNIGIRDSELINPRTVYDLSLRMGTSYQATLNRLFTLNIIKTTKKYAELDVEPIEIKKEYGIDKLSSSWNNIWILSEEEKNSTIYPNVGDEVRILLEENPTTGYKWIISPDIEGVTTFWNSFHEDSSLFGGSGIRNIILKIEEIQDIKLNLYNNRPWRPLSDSINMFNLNISVQKKRHGIHINNLVA
ncbi:ImmA/IrrE family metallo-endopeptidase [Radiobacillus kanasensis]|uniref:ImmA/IrrE family metallo-endopeptidase n=1 Tax=Radiobacillus kanasensis TaxID=2844358 RepID=UPI001E364452|nr:ImmA/IrrE family metallo-endopeptidase [Radiobacillus kanasensis]UFT99372.1 ImmA/IrrE family metallo-endopeptidase [Radiobacillus kanasensis]